MRFLIQVCCILLNFICLSALGMEPYAQFRGLLDLLDNGPKTTIRHIEDFLSSDDVRLRIIAKDIYFKVYRDIDPNTRKELLLNHLFHQSLIPMLAGLKPVSFSTFYIRADFISMLKHDLGELESHLRSAGVVITKLSEDPPSMHSGKPLADAKLHLMLVSQSAVAAIKDNPNKMKVLALAGLDGRDPSEWIDISAGKFPISNGFQYDILNGVLFGYPEQDVVAFAKKLGKPSVAVEIVPQIQMSTEIKGAKITLNRGSFSLFEFPFKTFTGQGSNNIKELQRALQHAGSIYLAGIKEGPMPTSILFNWKRLTCQGLLHNSSGPIP